MDHAAGVNIQHAARDVDGNSCAPVVPQVLHALRSVQRCPQVATLQIRCNPVDRHSL